MSNLSVATWRTWKNAPTDPDTATIQAAIDAAEEAIAGRCGREFVVASGSSARVFAAVSARSTTLEIDDCTAVSSVVENGSTIAATEYQLEPLNARDMGGMTVPYNLVRLLGGTWSPSNPGEASVTVTATWGWSALPKRYTTATEVLVADLLDARDIRNGVVGFSDYAAFRVRDNGTVAMLLHDLVRSRVIGVA